VYSIPSAPAIAGIWKSSKLVDVEIDGTDVSCNVTYTLSLSKVYTWMMYYEVVRKDTNAPLDLDGNNDFGKYEVNGVEVYLERAIYRYYMWQYELWLGEVTNSSTIVLQDMEFTKQE